MTMVKVIHISKSSIVDGMKWVSVLVTINNKQRGIRPFDYRVYLAYEYLTLAFGLEATMG